MKNKRVLGWGELFAGYALLAMYCLVMVFGFVVSWFFSLPSKLVRGVRR